MTPEKLTRLPMWAQREFENLRRDNGHKAAALASLEGSLAGDSRGPFGLSRGLRDDTLWLPSSQRVICVRLGDFELDLRASDSLQSLQVMATSHHGLIVRPQVTNVVHIERGRW